MRNDEPLLALPHHQSRITNHASPITHHQSRIISHDVLATGRQTAASDEVMQEFIVSMSAASAPPGVASPETGAPAPPLDALRYHGRLTCEEQER